MTFSNEVNKEISNIKLNSKLESLIELSAIIKTNASISMRNAFIYIYFVTESIFVAKRIEELIQYLYDYEVNISRLQNNNILKNGIYNISIDDENILNRILSDSGLDILGNYITDINVIFERIKSLSEKGYSAYLRGVFLGCGSIVDPNKNYHLEFNINNEEDAILLKKIFEETNIEIRKKNRKKKIIYYIKNSESIADFLNIIKANKALLELENIKVKKEIRNNINRKLNFDMANMNKTIETSLEQIRYIEILEKYNLLPESLKEISQLRKDNVEMSLKELGENLNKPLSKSAVAYKMKKIKNLAKKVDKQILKC